jgi:hypothetical protein
MNFVIPSRARNLTIEAWITQNNLCDSTGLWEILRIRSG